MKKGILGAVVCCVVVSLGIHLTIAQEKDNKGGETKSRLASQQLVEETNELDKQILDYSKKIEAAISKYDLLNLRDIRILPYQVSLDMGKDFIKVEKHVFIRSGFAGQIIGLKRKTMTIYLSGKSVTRFESEVYEKNYDASKNTRVKIIDNSPTTLGSDGLKFTHIENDRLLIKDKPMAEIRNTTAFPVKNNLKREFYIPHLTYFYGLIVNIAETYLKNLKDSDESMSQFLEESLQY